MLTKTLEELRKHKLVETPGDFQFCHHRWSSECRCCCFHPEIRKVQEIGDDDHSWPIALRGVIVMDHPEATERQMSLVDKVPSLSAFLLARKKYMKEGEK